VSEFSRQQTRELKKLLTKLPLKHASNDDVKRFLFNFISIEALSRKVWHYYRCRNGKSPKASFARIKTDVIKRAFIHFGMATCVSALESSFSSKLKKRGSRSAVVLRNGIVHSWSEEDRKEVYKRSDVLSGYSKQVIDAVQNRVSQEVAN
jgi:hypothetical protein